MLILEEQKGWRWYKLELLQALRAWSNPTLDLLWQSVTMLGEYLVLAGICFLVYWCIDKKSGRYLILCLGLSICINGILKDLVQAPRPFWQAGAPEALRLETATGYSFPSGHSQAAATLYTALAVQTRRSAVKAALAALILAVGFSRLYLGVHYLEDVAVGILLGAGTSLLVGVLLQRKMLRQAMTFCAMAAALTLLVAQSDDSYAAAGLSAGLLGGFWLERRVVFQKPKGAVQGAARLVGGFLLLGGFYLAVSLVWTKTPIVSFLKNAGVAFLATGGYPWLFQKWEKGDNNRKNKEVSP